MEKRLNNRNGMITTVLKLLDDNRSIWSDSPVMVALFESIRAKEAAINLENQTSGTTTLGSTSDKETVRMQLASETFVVGSVVYAWAHKAGNATIYKQVDYTLPKLQEARQSDLIKEAGITLKLARANQVMLEPQGITEERLTAFEALIASFETAVPTPRSVVTTRAVSGDKLESLIDEAIDELKHQADRLMAAYLVSNPEFYAAYRKSRKIVNYGIRHEKKDDATSADVAK